jgi:RNA-directed DNA polymerase
MKRYGNLYSQIYDLENLHEAYRICRKGKRLKREVLPFTFNLSENLCQIQRELQDKTYRVGEYFSFYVHEPKTRLVQALPFRDRIVQQALSAVITPRIEKSFIHDTYACIKGRGTHAGSNRLQVYIQQAYQTWQRQYCLKCDIQSYFPSINHHILLNLFEQKIKCPDTLWLIKTITNSNGLETGIPIGNLLSQLSANLYLSIMDHFIKEELKVRYYIRYMDDFCILNADKGLLKRLKDFIGRYLWDTLRLQLNRKTSIFPLSQGIDFLGYRTWAGYKLIRNRSKNRMRRRLRKLAMLYTTNRVSLKTINAIVQSWLGHCQHADTYRLKRDLLREYIFIKS